MSRSEVELSTADLTASGYDELDFFPNICLFRLLHPFQVLERDQKLSDLGDRANALQSGASQFEQSSRKLKRRYWWQNTKMNIIIGVVVLIIIIIILVSIFG